MPVFSILLYLCIVIKNFQNEFIILTLFLTYNKQLSKHKGTVILIVQWENNSEEDFNVVVWAVNPRPEHRFIVPSPIPLYCANCILLHGRLKRWGVFYEVKNGGNSFRNKSRCFMETDGKNGGGSQGDFQRVPRQLSLAVRILERRWWNVKTFQEREDYRGIPFTPRVVVEISSMWLSDFKV